LEDFWEEDCFDSDVFGMFFSGLFFALLGLIFLRDSLFPIDSEDLTGLED